jgi:hydroxypyruvate isomerase
MDGHICFSVSENCENMHDSYGEICVDCNCCGRVNKKTIHEDRVKTYARQLEEHIQHITGESFQTRLQQKNIVSNIRWFVDKIESETKEIKMEETL